jgi:hypothetical protein
LRGLRSALGTSLPASAPGGTREAGKQFNPKQEKHIMSPEQFTTLAQIVTGNIATLNGVDAPDAKAEIVEQIKLLSRIREEMSKAIGKDNTPT